MTRTRMKLSKEVVAAINSAHWIEFVSIDYIKTSQNATVFLINEEQECIGWVNLRRNKVTLLSLPKAGFSPSLKSIWTQLRPRSFWTHIKRIK